MKEKKDVYGLKFTTTIFTVFILLTIFFGILAYITFQITPQTEIRIIEFKCLLIATCVCGMISVIASLIRLWAETLTLLEIENNTFETEPQEESNVEKLREYKQLLDDGIITQEEFETKKQELL